MRELVAMMGKRLTDGELDDAMAELDKDGNGPSLLSAPPPPPVCLVLTSPPA